MFESYDPRLETVTCKDKLHITDFSNETISLIKKMAQYVELSSPSLGHVPLPHDSKVIELQFSCFCDVENFEKDDEKYSKPKFMYKYALMENGMFCPTGLENETDRQKITKEYRKDMNGIFKCLFNAKSINKMELVRYISDKNKCYILEGFYCIKNDKSCEWQIAAICVIQDDKKQLVPKIVKL